jgi:hypothetical protein
MRHATTIKIAAAIQSVNPTVSRCIEELSMPPAGRAALDARDCGRMKQHWRVGLRPVASVRPFPLERLISNSHAAHARSTANSSPAVCSPLIRVMSETAALPPTYPLELSKLRVEHTPCTAGSNSGRPDRSDGMYPLGGCDDEPAQAHSGVGV